MIKARFQLDYGEFNLEVDLQLPNQGISVLFGHSGSGKTTVLRCIAGLQQAQQGYLEINNQVWQDSQNKLFLPPHKRNIGYVFQEANLFPHLSVLGNVQYGLKRMAKPTLPLDLNHIFTLLGIERLLKRKPDQLSGGERQRVAIARALALQPEILLMDEPLASLDLQRKQEILPYLEQLHRELNIPIVYVTHARQEVAQLADYVIVMAAGRTLATGSLSETLSRLDTPFAQDREAASVWHAKVVAHDVEYHLTRVAFSDGYLDVPLLVAAIGQSVRIQINARDVSITLKASLETSILNVLPATIMGILPVQFGHVVVQLSLGEEVVLAHISHKSLNCLGLQTGMSVYVQIKGTSILN